MDSLFSIRKATFDDLPRILEIYERARSFMVEHGNARQWALSGWPPESLVESDIQDGISYVVQCNGTVEGVFVYMCGHNIESCYNAIEGAWIGGPDYAVVHRIASRGCVKGVGKAALDWAYRQSHHLRIDTHPDNSVMQNLLLGCGFTKCGIIHIEEDNDPRLAFEKV